VIIVYGKLPKEYIFSISKSKNHKEKPNRRMEGQ